MTKTRSLSRAFLIALFTSSCVTRAIVSSEPQEPAESSSQARASSTQPVARTTHTAGAPESPPAPPDPPALDEPALEGRQRTSVWLRLREMKPQDDKFGLEGSIFAIGDPVHETMTLIALEDSGIASSGVRIGDKDARQYIRGVFWNDDPCGQLLADDVGVFPSLGVKWYNDFSKAKNGEGGLSCGLLGRSHFGDLQFLHAMASRDGVPAEETRRKVMMWAEFCYGVATEEIPGVTRIGDLPVNDLLKLPEDTTVNQVFQSTRSLWTSPRAAGSLLHLVQDSYAGGHVAREANGLIKEFHSYSGQDADKHDKADQWNSAGSDRQRIRRLGGGSDALQTSTWILQKVALGQKWTDVALDLANGPFRLSDAPRLSGPGGQFAKSE